MTISWLIAVDGSEPSLRAVDHVIAEAASCQLKPHIFLINVQAPLSSDITRFIDEKIVQEHHRETADIALAGARKKMAQTALACSAHILIGEAAPTIVDFAKDKGCHMIVMGAHGFGSVVSMLMGSVTVKVVHLSAIPVLLIK